MGEASDEQQLTREIAARRAELSRDLDALTDRVSPAQVYERRKQATRTRVRSWRERVMGSAQESRQRVAASGGSTADTVGGSAHSAVETIERRTEGNPLAAGLIAFGAGWLASSLLPATGKEAEMARQAVDRAKEHGQPLVDEARSVGQEMGEQLKGSATEAADRVRSTAQDSAQAVKQEGQSSAQHVSEDVRGRSG